jgi:hypothetical protein
LGWILSLRKKADLSSKKSQLRLFAATKFKHGFASQGTRQTRGKASHEALKSLLTETTIIVAKNPSQKPGELRERANRNVNSAPLKLICGKGIVVETTETIKLGPRE